MISNNSGSEGIFYNDFPFIAGNSYDVLIYYNFYGTTSPVTNDAWGSFAVYAASKVTDASGDCQDTPPTAPARQAMYEKSATEQTYFYSSTGDLQTVTQLGSGYNQIWIYPTSTPGYQNDLDVYEIKVCPSCFAIATYSTSTVSPLPVQVNGQDITITEPAQPLPTLVEATQAIYLQKGFTTSSASNATFVAEISPNCSYSNVMALSTRGNSDSSMMTSIPNTFPGSADSASASLRVYPTVSSGVFFISGSPASLANAAISVFDETGQLRYQLDNTAGSTLQLNLAKLPSGLYFVRIRQQSKVTVKKIVISH
jgi:hypothetical protein